MKRIYFGLITLIAMGYAIPSHSGLFDIFKTKHTNINERVKSIEGESIESYQPESENHIESAQSEPEKTTDLLPVQSRSYAKYSAPSNDINYAKKLDRARIEVAERAIPAVVFIKTEYHPQQGYNSQNDLFADDFFNRFFGAPPRRNPFAGPQVERGQGSGFLISKDGYILTNYHVVNNASNITVDLNDKEQSSYSAELIGGDAQTDIAIIKIDRKESFPYLEFEEIENVHVGESAIAVGNPFDLVASVTAGIVSAKGRNDLQLSDLEDFLQTDAAIYPGNSGGPLLNLDCKVIGMNTAILTSRGNFVGIGFAIPCSILKVITNQLIQTGIITRGYIGVQLQDVEPNMTSALGLDRARGAIVTQVSPHSPAEKSGLKQGDVILEVDGKIMKNREMVRNSIAILPQGSTIHLCISRMGKAMDITVVIGKNESREISQSQTAQRLGLEVATLNPDLAAKYGYKNDDTGVIVTGIRQGSIASLARMHEGMLIVNVNHQPIANIDEFNQALEETKGNNVFLLANDRGRHTFISLSLKK